jgi:folate-binding protein YgfZ
MIDRNPFRIILLLVLVANFLDFVSSFSLLPTTTTRIFRAHRRHYSSDFDYEYIPPNPNSFPEEDSSILNLRSSYPPGTPSGLRGEAVRSALKSGRCVCWNLSDSPLSHGGILKIQGRGTLDFINNKFTQSFDGSPMSFQDACLLNGKGRTVDRLRIAVLDGETAIVLTSPGHSSQDLLERLDPFIFPLDQVKLTNLNQACMFTVASTQWADVQTLIREQVVKDSSSSYSFPSKRNKCAQWRITPESTLLLFPSTGLPSVTCVGYTLIFLSENRDDNQGARIWQYLINEYNTEGPIEVGPSEYETLRIEAGQAAYGKEVSKDTKASPLELHWQRETINMDKGCYLGQEGVASIVKNKRGPPRTLYRVVFEDESNIYATVRFGKQR